MKNAANKSIRLMAAVAGLTWAGVSLAQTWNVNANGNWGTAANWSPASVPNGIGASASLLNIITAPRTVSLNVPVTLGNLTFGGGFNYTIGGTNTLTFDAAAGNATLDVSGTAAHTISRPMVLTDTLVVNQGSSGTLTLSGARSGAGGLIKNGTGQVTLSGASTFFGPAQINAGTLLYNTAGAIPAASLVTLGDGIGAAGSAVLNLNAAMSVAQALNVTLASDGLLIQNNNRLVRLSAVSGTGELRLNAAVGNGFEIVGTGGDTTFNGAVTGGIAVNSANPATGSRFTKTGTATQTLGGNNTYVARTFINDGSLRAASNTALGAASAGFNNATFVSGTGSLELSNNIATAERIYLNGAGNGGAGALRNFSGNNTITGNVTLGWTGGTVTSSAVSIGADAGSTLTISGNIDGAQSLTKVGAGLLVLSGNNTWSGATTVNAGTMRLGAGTGMTNATVLTVNGGTLDLNGFSKTVTNLSGTGGAIALGAGALTVNQVAAGTYAGVIGGTGALIKNSAGTLTLTGANTYTGGTTVNAGTLQGNATSLQGNIANNAAVIFNQAAAGTYAGVMSGTGSLTKSNTGTLILIGANTYTGRTTVSAGTLQGNSTSLQGNIVNAAAVVFDQAVAGTYASVLSGTGSLTKSGAGTLTLTGVNTYAGGTSFNGGTLAAASDAQLGTGNLTFNGGALQTTAAFNSAKAASLLGAGTIDTNGFAASLGGAITGAGSLVKVGAGTMTLTGTNTYSGGTTVSAGALQGNSTSLQGNIVNSAAVVFDQAAAGTYAGLMSGTGSLTKNSAGTLTLTGANTYTGGTYVNAGTMIGNSTSLQGNIANNAAVVFDQSAAGTYAGVMSGTGSLTKSNSGTLILTGANTYAGGTTVNAGALQGDSASLQGNIVNNAAVVFDQAAAGTYAGAMSGSGALTKLGMGNLTIAGVNTFSGTTSVNAGTLTVLGSMTSNLTLASGATLTGSGTVGGISAAAGSIVAPGNPNAMLTANGAYTHSDGAIFRVHADASGAASRLNIAGAATLAGGIVDVQAADGNYAPATRYTILNASAGVGGAFSSVTSNLAFLTPTLVYDPTSVFLTLARNDIDFAVVALTPNQREVSNALDRAAASNATGDMANVIDAVSALSAPMARSTYESMSGLMHTLLPTIGISDASQFNRATASRLRTRTDGAAGTGLAWSGIKLASGPSPQSDAPALFASTGATRSGATDAASRNVWLSGYNLDGDLDGDAGSGAYDYRINGLIIGVDTDIDRRWTAGLSAAFSDWSVRSDGRGDRSDVQAYRIGAYGRFTEGPVRVDGVIGYGKVEYETDRRIVFGAINRTAHGDYSGDQFTANLVGRYRLEHGSYGIEPFAALQYVRESQDDFVEGGADSINLAVASRTLKSTRGTLGARVDRAFETAGGKGLVEIRAGYSREFSGVPRIGATFTGDPTRTGLGIVAENFDRESWLAGAGVSFAPKKNLTLYVDVNGDFQSQATLVSVMAGIRASW